MVKHVRIIEETQWQSETENWNGKLCRFATFTGLIFFFFFVFLLGENLAQKKTEPKKNMLHIVCFFFVCANVSSTLRKAKWGVT